MQLRLDADWVILSACNTAARRLPGAEAMSGLASAFLFAGARALLVSHWPVYSSAAVALTTGAIRALEKDSSIGRAEALRQAMLKLIESGKDAEVHPGYWAPLRWWEKAAAGRRENPNEMLAVDVQGSTQGIVLRLIASCYCLAVWEDAA